MGIPIGDGYEVDPDTAQQYAAQLHAGVDTLNEILQTAQDQARVPAPGRDQASGYYLKAHAEALDAHREWNLGQQKQLKAHAEAITAALKSYQETDTSSAARA